MISTVHFSSLTDCWATPLSIYAALNEEFRFDLDPCPLNRTTDGLSLDLVWRGHRVFCNPPYGPGIANWLERGLEAELAVFLLPARTDTRWFHEIVLPKAKEIRFLRGRLSFGEDPRKRAPFPSMVVLFHEASFSHLMGTAMRDADAAAEQYLIDQEGKA